MTKSLLKGQCNPGQQLLSVNIYPDFFSNEISWKVLQNNIPIKYGNSNNDSICVDTSQCIVFIINDSGNDGICCNYGNGFFEVFLDNNKIANGTAFGSVDSTYYNCPNAPISLEDDGVYVPTAFSPNNVGHETNNKFSIITNETVSSIDFFIYDRWGELIFKTDNMYFSWDGTFHEKDCSSGVYAYQCVIFYDNQKKKIKTGNITLIR
jgi:gliding motility-associated-like protein